MNSRFAALGVDPGSIPAAKVRSPAYRRRSERAALALGGAREAIAGLTPGMHIFGLSRGQFSMIDLAAAALELTGPADVAVWTWCIAGYEVEAVSAFIGDGRIARFRMVLDWTGAQRDMPLIEDLQRQFGADCLRVTKTHAKIVAVAAEGWQILIRGSMNLNANPRFEQFDVSEGGPAYAVVMAAMDELWERGKPVPVRSMAHPDAVAAFGGAPAAMPGWAPRSRQWW